MEVVRFPPLRSRPVLDFSKFFIRYGKPEQEAVAAFDFLEEISTSESEILTDSTRRSRSASQPLSREAVLRQAGMQQNLQKASHSSTAPRPLSETDFAKYRLPDPPLQTEMLNKYHNFLHPYPRAQKVGERQKVFESHLHYETNISPDCTNNDVCPSKHSKQKLRRRRKRSELRERSQSNTIAASREEKSTGLGGKMFKERTSPSKVTKGGKERRENSKSRREWRDIRVGDTPASDHYYESMSSSDSSNTSDFAHF